MRGAIFPRGRKWGVLFFSARTKMGGAIFSARAKMLYIYTKRGCYLFSASGVLFFPRGRKWGVLFFSRADKKGGCYFFSARVLKRRFTDFVKRLFRRRPFLCELLSRPPSERQTCGGPKQEKVSELMTREAFCVSDEQNDQLK